MRSASNVNLLHIFLTIKTMVSFRSKALLQSNEEVSSCEQNRMTLGRDGSRAFQQ